MKNRPPRRKPRAAEIRAVENLERDRRAVARIARKQRQQPTGFMIFRSVVKVGDENLPDDHPLVNTAKYDNGKLIRVLGIVSRFQARAVPPERASDPVAQKEKLVEVLGSMKPSLSGHLGRISVIDDLRSAAPKSFVIFHFEQPLRSTLRAESSDLLACMGIQDLEPLTPRLAVYATTDRQAAQEFASQLIAEDRRIPIILGAPYPQPFRV